MHTHTAAWSPYSSHHLLDGTPWATNNDFKPLIRHGLAGSRLIGLMPAWQASAIITTIDGFAPTAKAVALKEITDLSARCDEQGFNEGTHDWAQGMSLRLLRIKESESEYQYLDLHTYLSPQTTDQHLISGAARRMAHYFESLHFLPENAPLPPDLRLALAEVDKMGIGLPTNPDPQKIWRRVCDYSWWKRTIRQNLRVRREEIARLLDARQILWCSADGLKERREHDFLQEKWAESMMFSDGAGGSFPCPTPQQTARRQYAELMERNRSVSEIANEEGLTECCILTITPPSRYHAVTTLKNGKVIRNKNWDLSTPSDAAKWEKPRWARMRACLNRSTKGKPARKATKRRPYRPAVPPRPVMGQHFVKGTQFFKDGSPHWHIVFFESRKNFQQLKELAQKYFDGGNEFQIDLREVPAEEGLGYVCRAAQYVTRDMGTGGGDPEKELEATCTKQMASTYRLRRFSTSQGGVTGYRLCRRQDILPDHAMGKAAKSGDYKTFYKNWKESKAKLYRTPSKNKYQEPIKTISGLIENGEIHIKSANWKIVRRSEVQEQNQKRTLTLNHQEGEALKPQPLKTERQEAREWLERYISEQEQKPKPAPTTQISDEEYAKAYKEWRKRNRH